jgi:hypothetical protein
MAKQNGGCGLCNNSVLELDDSYVARSNHFYCVPIFCSKIPISVQYNLTDGWSPNSLEKYARKQCSILLDLCSIELDQPLS